MNIDEIMTLIKAVSDSALTGFELEEGNIKLSFKKETEKIIAAAPAAVCAVQENAVVSQSVSAPVSRPEETPSQTDIGSDKVVVSPLVGTFYASSSPEAESYVKEGDTVKKGQVLGIIEAMKLMNEIESEYDGVIEAILVNNEDVVEYGQPLFRIR
jgi:acetyl-CoA carboxylase biotin carboxyl carrier protein